MGAKYWPKSNKLFVKYTHAYEFDGKIAFSPEELKYHTSWDWLMTAVDRINKLWDNIIPDDEEKYLKAEHIMQVIHLAVGLVDFETAWNSTVEFIEFIELINGKKDLAESE